MGKTKKTIQQRVAETVLQRPMTFALGRRTYKAAPPTIGTLILVSDMLSRMPDLHLDGADVFRSTLRAAKDSSYLPEICATLILGAKGIDRKEFIWFGRTRLARLTERIRREASPAEVSRAISEIVAGMGVGDFFAISTFLQGLNLTKPTKVENASAPTASGR